MIWPLYLGFLVHFLTILTLIPFITFRMDSLFRLLLHDQNLVQGDHPDPGLLMSIEYHKRDLATILETAKWQVFVHVETGILV